MTHVITLRGVFDFVNHPCIDRYRDVEWERWITMQPSAPYGVPRYPDRESAFAAAATIPQRPKISCVDSWIVLDRIVLPFLEDTSGATVHYGASSASSFSPAAPPVMSEEDLDISRMAQNAVSRRGKFGRNVRGTVEFLWNVMRCGIVVAIRNGKIVCFCPFYNPAYENAWPPGVPAGAESCPRTKHTLPVEKWWANGGILCTEPYAWGTHFCMQIKDFFAEVAARYNIADAVFCINKRDYPQYKYNHTLGTLVEPYGFLFDRDDRDPFQDIPLSACPEGVLPMFSFYGGERFLDLLMPPTEDLEAALRVVYVPDDTFNPTLSRMAIRDLTGAAPLHVEPLSAKRPVAFFRGSATGSGTTPLTNQRLRLFTYARMQSSPWLDVGCVSMKQRLHKHFTEPVSVISNPSFPVSDTFYVPMSEQIKNKYLIYVEGHCAACRLGLMLSTGCVVLKVESECVASELFFSHLLVPHKHYVPVRADLSDLLERIAWLEAHPKDAQQIATDARAFWETYLSHDALVLYMGLQLSMVVEA